jgi:hypothetical protein
MQHIGIAYKMLRRVNDLGLAIGRGVLNYVSALDPPPTRPFRWLDRFRSTPRTEPNGRATGQLGSCPEVNMELKLGANILAAVSAFGFLTAVVLGMV